MQTIYALTLFLGTISIANLSNASIPMDIIYDYEAEGHEDQKKRGVWHEPTIDLIANLDKAPDDYELLDKIISEPELDAETLGRVGSYYVMLPESAIYSQQIYKLKKDTTTDARGLHILFKTYFTGKVKYKWHLFHLAHSILSFQKYAEETLLLKDPIESALEIYKQWYKKYCSEAGMGEKEFEAHKYFYFRASILMAHHAHKGEEDETYKKLFAFMIDYAPKKEFFFMKIKPQSPLN